MKSGYLDEFLSTLKPDATLLAGVVALLYSLGWFSLTSANLSYNLGESYPRNERCIQVGIIIALKLLPFHPDLVITRWRTLGRRKAILSVLWRLTLIFPPLYLLSTIATDNTGISNAIFVAPVIGLWLLETLQSYHSKKSYETQACWFIPLVLIAIVISTGYTLNSLFGGPINKPVFVKLKDSKEKFTFFLISEDDRYLVGVRNRTEKIKPTFPLASARSTTYTRLSKDQIIEIESYSP